MGFLSEAKNPKAWISLQGIGGEGPAEGASCWSGGSEGLGEALSEGPLPPFPVWRGCSPPPTQGEGGCPFCTLTFKLTSGLDLIRMEQRNPGVQLSVVGFVRVKTKSLSKWLRSVSSDEVRRGVGGRWPLTSFSLFLLSQHLEGPHPLQPCEVSSCGDATSQCDLVRRGLVWTPGLLAAPRFPDSELAGCGEGNTVL